MKLSVIMPVYNEDKTLPHIIEKVKSINIDKELIIIDDGSNDRTKQVLNNIIGGGSIKIISHPVNKGKGAAIRTALDYVTGEVVIIQDADLEYEPDDYHMLMEPIKNNMAEVVYGSRFLVKDKVTSPVHFVINRFLTLLTNLLLGVHLTDMETCYKMFKTKIIKELNLSSNGFEIEPELTIKTLKKGYKIYEVPISYKPRSYHEGKKITAVDGIKTIWAIIRYRFSH